MFMHNSFFFFLKQVWLWEFAIYCIYLLSSNCLCEHVASCALWLFCFLHWGHWGVFSTRHGDPDIINQYQSTVSRPCGPSLLVLRTLEHYLEHWGSKVLPTPLGGEKIFFYITDVQSTFTKCHLCINIYLFIYLFICLFVCLFVYLFGGCIYFYYYY